MGLRANVETPPRHKYYCHMIVSHESTFLANENKIPREQLHDFCVNQGLEYVLPVVSEATTGNECSEFTAGLSGA